MDIKRKQIFIVVSISLVAILVSIVFFYLRNKQGVKTNTPKTDFQIFTISENRKRELLLDDTDVIFYDAVNQMINCAFPARACYSNNHDIFRQLGKKRSVHFHENIIFSRFGDIRRIKRHAGGLNNHILISEINWIMPA